MDTKMFFYNGEGLQNIAFPKPRNPLCSSAPIVRSVFSTDAFI